VATCVCADVPRLLQEFAEQIKRKPKDGTPLAYDTPTSLFSTS